MFVKIIFSQIILFFFTFFMNPQPHEVKVCKTEDCQVDYCFNFVEGSMMVHFGRWATPMGISDLKATQNLCLEGCNNVNVENAPRN